MFENGVNLNGSKTVVLAMMTQKRFENGVIPNKSYWGSYKLLNTILKPDLVLWLNMGRVAIC